MKKYGKDILKLVIFLSLGGFFMWLLLKNPEQRATILTRTTEIMQNNLWMYLILCMFIGFLSVVFRGLRSVLMIEPLGYKVTKINSYHAAMIGYLANFAFPRLGEVLRCTILQKYEKVPFQKSLGTVITERVIDMILFGVLFLIALGLESKKLLFFMEENMSLTVMFSGMGKLVVFGLIVGIFILILLFRKKILKWAIYQKIRKFLKGFWDGLISIKDLKKPFLFVVYSLLIWVCYYLMFYVCTFAFPDLAVLGTKGVILASLACVVIGTLGFATPIPGGVGVYPILISKAFVLYGIDENLGGAIGTIIWTTETLMYVVLGLVSVLIILRKKDKIKV